MQMSGRNAREESCLLQALSHWGEVRLPAMLEENLSLLQAEVHVPAFGSGSYLVNLANTKETSEGLRK
jgi:hypothetical protein